MKTAIEEVRYHVKELRQKIASDKKMYKKTDRIKYLNSAARKEFLLMKLESALAELVSYNILLKRTTK